jgi:hypothetical protein
MIGRARARHRRGQRGITLLETFVWAGLIGLIAVMVTPIESFLIRKLRDLGPERTVTLDMERAARTLAADARRATVVSIEEEGGLRFQLSGGDEVVWSLEEEGLLRGGRGGNGRRLPRMLHRGIREMEVLRPRPTSLQVTLEGGDGGHRRVAVWLRNARGGGG